MSSPEKWTNGIPCKIAEGSDNGSGYIRKDGMYAHVRACTEAHGPRPSWHHTVHHKCGNRACIEPSHVMWMSTSDQNKKENQPGRKPPVRRSRALVRQVTFEFLFTDATSYELSEKYGIPSCLIRQWGTGYRHSEWTQDLRATATAGVSYVV